MNAFFIRGSIIGHWSGCVTIAQQIEKYTGYMKNVCVKDKQSSFKLVLEKDSSVSIDNRNIQRLTTEMYKAAVSRKFGHCYFLRDFFDALCDNY